MLFRCNVYLQISEPPSSLVNDRVSLASWKCCLRETGATSSPTVTQILVSAHFSPPSSCVTETQVCCVCLNNFVVVRVQTF